MTPVQGELTAWARDLAARYLDVPEFREDRWRHVQAVGAKAGQLAPMFGADGSLLVASAWLHDIGYADSVKRIGFHPLDGAWCLDAQGVDPRLSGLVANHSGAAAEAQLRGLGAEMSAYPDARDAIRDALWTCDMTTSPEGDPVPFSDRLAEIVERYGPEHTVPRAITAEADEIRRAIERTAERASQCGISITLET